MVLSANTEWNSASFPRSQSAVAVALGVEYTDCVSAEGQDTPQKKNKKKKQKHRVS